MEVYEGVDIYTKNYDYEDIKVAICVAEFLDNIPLSFDFEIVVKIAIHIRDEWERREQEGLLTEEEYAYIQRFAINYLNEYKEELKQWN